jgi:CBS domain containing-hemolysin-like protein
MLTSLQKIYRDITRSSTDMTDSTAENRDKSLLQRLKSFLHIKGSPDTTRELEHEIQELLEDGEEQGLISSHEEQLINSIFDFRDTVASEIMTPMVEMVSADVDSAPEELVRLITEEGYTRIPVFSDSHDNIIGILHAKDLLRICSMGSEKSLRLQDVLNPPMIIGESKPITELLRDFQSKKNHMAIVTDEFGGVRGLVTLEDVIEEIVGEIDDEHDQEERELMVVDEQTIVVDAKIEIEEVEDHFNCRLPEGAYESVGGLLIERLGRVPENGDQVQVASLTFKVLAADPRRVRTVRIRQG